MTKEQEQKKALAEATILSIYKKYINKKETTVKAVSSFQEEDTMTLNTQEEVHKKYRRLFIVFFVPTTTSPELTIRTITIQTTVSFQPFSMSTTKRSIRISN